AVVTDVQAGAAMGTAVLLDIEDHPAKRGVPGPAEAHGLPPDGPSSFRRSYARGPPCLAAYRPVDYITGNTPDLQAGAKRSATERPVAVQAVRHPFSGALSGDQGPP